MDIKEYKCPNCGGSVKFDTAAQGMKCPFCDSEFEIAALEAYQKEISSDTKDSYEWTAEDDTVWDNPEADNLAASSCPSCGAEIIGDQNTISTVCPCCGNAQLVAKRFSGMLKPDYVIPFAVEKNEAGESLKKFCKGKPLLPRSYLGEKKIKDMQGMYAPFWLFDAKTHGNVRFKATKVKTWSDSNYVYTKTSHFSVTRGGPIDFEKIPVDGSEKLDDKFMDAIEPFNYKEMKDFQPAFLSGYLAEKYDVDAEKSKPRAEQRIKGTVEAEFRKTVNGYATVKTENTSVNVKDGKVSYGLFPIWIFNTKYREENYQFMMNGQTGSLAGRLPVDKGRAWMFRGGIAGILGMILTLIILFGFREAVGDTPAVALAVAWLISILAGIGAVHQMIRKMDTAHLKTNAAGYVVPGSFRVEIQQDRYLYSTTARVPKLKAPSSTAMKRRR